MRKVQGNRLHPRRWNWHTVAASIKHCAHDWSSILATPPAMPREKANAHLSSACSANGVAARHCICGISSSTFKTARRSGFGAAGFQFAPRQAVAAGKVQPGDILAGTTIINHAGSRCRGRRDSIFKRCWAAHAKNPNNPGMCAVRKVSARAENNDAHAGKNQHGAEYYADI